VRGMYLHDDQFDCTFLPCDVMVVCYMLSSCVCWSVHLSNASIVSKWLKLGSCKQHRTIAHGLLFSVAKDIGKIQTGSPQIEAPNTGGIG